MKKFILSICILFQFVLITQAQNNLVVFSQGEQFYLIVNGIIQNQKPQTNVKVVDIIQPNIKVKILFKDSTIAPLEKNISFMETGTEYLCDIVNPKGVRKLRLVSQAPIAVNAPQPPSQSVVVYTTTPPVTTTTTTTTVTNGMPQDNISVNMNVGTVGMNMSVNAGTNMSSTMTSTTTTTSTSTMNEPQESHRGNYSPSGCAEPMHSYEFDDARNSIASKPFEDTKLSQAEQIMKSNCLTAKQVKEIMKVFTYEETRLTFAKKAYLHTVDPSNYYMVNDAFTYSTSVDELNNYLAKN